MKKIVVAALAVVVCAVPAQAASILDRYLGAPGDCYYRYYDAAHLKAHPKQRVQAFFITYDDSYQDSQSELTLYFQFTMRNGVAFSGVGICNGNTCGVEGDGGQFTLSPYRDGLLLKVDPKRGMFGEVGSARDGQINGSDYSDDLNDSDDREFLLYPARPAACDY